LFSCISNFLYQKLSKIPEDQVAGLAKKHLKEIKSHLRHSKQWVLRLGDGTDESNHRIQYAFNELSTYTGELFHQNEIDTLLQDEQLDAGLDKFKYEWNQIVAEKMEEERLDIPES